MAGMRETAGNQITVVNVDNSVVDGEDSDSDSDSDSSFRGFTVEDIESVAFSDISEDEHEVD